MFKEGIFCSSDASLLQSAIDFLSEWSREGAVLKVQTSGSTGKPKLISIQKSQMVLSASKTNDFFKLNTSTKAFLCLSIETIAGKMMLARAIVGNYSLRIEKPSSNPLSTITDCFDFMAIVPLQLETILNETPTKLDLVKTIIVGGAPVSDMLKKQLKNSKKSVFQTFGMTETVSHVALKKIGFEESSYYEALSGITFSEQNGNLIINYIELLAEPLLTTDLVRLESETRFEWLGRIDFIINSGGVKLNPALIENKLSSLIPFPFFISSLPDNFLGNKVVLVLESKEIIHFSKSNFESILTRFEIPKLLTNMLTFERTSSGKINRIETLSKIVANDWKPIL